MWLLRVLWKRVRMGYELTYGSAEAETNEVLFRHFAEMITDPDFGDLDVCVAMLGLPERRELWVGHDIVGLLIRHRPDLARDMVSGF